MTLAGWSALSTLLLVLATAAWFSLWGARGNASAVGFAPLALCWLVQPGHRSPADAPQRSICAERDGGQKFATTVFHFAMLALVALICWTIVSRGNDGWAMVGAAIWMTAALWLTRRNWKNRNAC